MRLFGPRFSIAALIGLTIIAINLLGAVLRVRPGVVSATTPAKGGLDALARCNMPTPQATLPF
jgi:hypothetical protein